MVVITFILTRALPGDPAAYFAGAAATQEAIAQVRAQLGLDKPLLEQFFLYVADLARGDMGLSLTTGQPVAQELLARLPASLEMVFLALLLACAIALPLGVLAATRPGSWIDQLCRLVTTAGVSLPTFFTGLLLAYVFYFLLGWAPSPMGRLDPMFSPPPTVTGLYLIDAALAGDAGAVVGQLEAADPAGADDGHLRAGADRAHDARVDAVGAVGRLHPHRARQRACRRTTVLVTYALRNALLPVVTTLGMVFGFMLGSSVIVEKVFGWPGVGSYAIDALTASDYAPVQGFVLAMGVLFVLLNLLVDLLYGADRSARERRRHERSTMNSTWKHVRHVLGENPVTMLAVALFTLFVLMAIFGPSLVPYDPLASDSAAALQPPSAAHWFGTDALGRDIFSRTVVATRLDLGIAVSAVAASFVIGMPLGLAAGFFGGWWDRIVTRAVRHHHGLPAVRAGDGHRRRARQHGGQHRAGHRDHQPAVLRARGARRGQRAPRRRLDRGGAAVGQRRRAHPGGAPVPERRCRRRWCRSA